MTTEARKLRKDSKFRLGNALFQIAGPIGDGPDGTTKVVSLSADGERAHCHYMYIGYDCGNGDDYAGFISLDYAVPGELGIEKVFDLKANRLYKNQYGDVFRCWSGDHYHPMECVRAVPDGGFIKDVAYQVRECGDLTEIEL